jgi:hypothetical protein
MTAAVVPVVMFVTFAVTVEMPLEGAASVTFA